MLKSRQDFIAYRETAKKAYDAQSKKIVVCAGTGCVASGSLKIHERLKQIMEEKGRGNDIFNIIGFHTKNWGRWDFVPCDVPKCRRRTSARLVIALWYG